MKNHVDAIDRYMATLPEGRKPAIEKLRNVVIANLPDGFEEQIANVCSLMLSLYPFVLTKEEAVHIEDFVSSGFPFCAMPIKLEKQMDFSKSKKGNMKLSGVQAAAAKIVLGEKELGWCWAPEWTIELPNDLEEGTHTLSVELIPNTFNVYGPHHHIYGDIPLVSSDQYKGIKNCVDPKDAPDNTLVDRWNFRCFGIHEEVWIVG